MKQKIHFLLLAGILVLAANPAQSQLLKKLKEKAEEKVIKKVSGEENKNPGKNEQDTGTAETDGNPNGRPVNKGGGGLTNTTPPDVLLQIADAEKAHEAGNFSDARYSVQQALIGLELQIGKDLLKSLPDTVNNLPEDTTQDRVMSTQWGWSNLTMQRVYYDGKDKQLTITIGNNTMYAGFVNLYFSGMYTQSDGNTQNTKQVRVKGNKAIIQYDDSKGYTLIVPLGQTSMIVWECINFTDENEVIRTAELFDTDDIKRRLGEQ